MKLQSLTLENFRQFYGVQTIDFSTDEKANVTVIHGENGSGKTVLLNAFKWVFYGATDFEVSEEKALLSERLEYESAPGQSMRVSVKLVFEHDNIEFSAERTAIFAKSDDFEVSQVGKSKLALGQKFNDGSFDTSPNPETHINQILPARMHPYFFFNGERIEKLSALDASSDVQTAVKGMMGIEILERARNHVQNGVVKQFKKDLKASSRDELSKVIEDEAALTDQKEKIQEDIQQIDTNLRHLHTHRQDINNRLQEIGPIADLQKERNELEEEINALDAERSEVKEERQRLISASGFLVFTQDLNKNASALLEERRKRGELPTKVKSQFLNDLIEAQKCICGRELLPGHEATKCIEDFKTHEVAEDVENAFIEVSGALTAMTSRPDAFKSELRHLNSRLVSISHSINKKHGRIDEISAKVGGSGDVNATDLEAKRDKIIGEISSQDQEIGRLKVLLENLESAVKTVSDQRRELTKKGDAERQATEKLDKAEEVSGILSALYESLSDRVRSELSEIVNQTFQKIMRKGYWAEIAPDYSLRIKKEVGSNVQEVLDKSQGESQITSLSFIGGLVSLAKKRHEANTQYYKGGLFPIVMDSPYGNLDSEYRAKVAEAIPNLAEQVVLMVSNSQWRGEVNAAVGLRSGKEYTLIYHTPLRKEDTITKSVVEDSEYEYTEIREGYYE